MTFQSTAGFLQWFVLYKLLAFSYGISPMGQVLLGGSVACPAPAELVGAVVREPLGLPAPISCVGYHSPITVVLRILKYHFFHVVIEHNVLYKAHSWCLLGMGLVLFGLGVGMSMNNIPALQIQSVERVGTKSKVTRKPTLKSALWARPQADLPFAGFLEIPEKHQGFVHCWSFKPSDMCVWWTNRALFFTPWANSTSWWGVRFLPPDSIPLIQRLLEVCKTYLEPHLGVGVTGYSQEGLGCT